ALGLSMSAQLQGLGAGHYAPQLPVIPAGGLPAPADFVTLPASRPVPVPTIGPAPRVRAANSNEPGDEADTSDARLNEARLRLIYLKLEAIEKENIKMREALEKIERRDRERPFLRGTGS